jgi:hypothetical protein
MFPRNLIQLGLRYRVFGWPLVLSACVAETAAPLQDPARFAAIYAQILIANEVDMPSHVPQLDDQNAKMARADSVLGAHGFDRQQFEAAIKHFSKHPERWQKVYKHVTELLEKTAKTTEAPKH